MGDALVRYETLREKARGQLALLAERRRGVDRELSSSVDAGVIASLESEQAQLRAEADQAERDASAIELGAHELSEAEGSLAEERLRFESDWGDGVPALTGEAAGLRGELAALRSAIERTHNDRSRLESRRASLAERVERLGAEVEQTEQERTAAAAALPELGAAVDAAAGARVAAEVELAGAEQRSIDAEAEHSAWSARVEALTLALDEARQRAGAEHLAGLDGVLGTLLDLVEVDPGWEESFEAAAGEALGAVVVADVDAARRSLASLRQGDHHGAVLALDGVAGTSAAPPPVGEPVRHHVRAVGHGGAAAGIERVLDALLSSAVAIDGGWEDAVPIAAQHPAAVVVTRGGDRFGISGWRIGAARSGATGAALDEARARTESSLAARDRVREQVETIRGSVAESRRIEQEATRARDANESRRRSLDDAARRLAGDADEATAELEALGAHLGELVDRHARETARVAELEELLPQLEAAEHELTARARAMAEARQHLEDHSARVGAMRTDLEVRAAGVEERRRFVTERLEQVTERLSRNIAERDEAARRRVELQARAEATDRLTAFVSERIVVIETNLGQLREERRRQSDEATRRHRSTGCVALGALHRRASAGRGPGQGAEGRDRRRRGTPAAGGGHRDAAPRPRHRARCRDRRRGAAPSRGCHRGRPRPRARTRAADHGPDQPPCAPGVRGAPAAPHVPGGTARGHPPDPS